MANSNHYPGKSIFKCAECRKEFKDYHRKRADRKFCSTECGYKNKQRRVNVNCEYCGVEFEAHAYYLKRGKGKYCSRLCYSRWKSENWVGENNPHYGETKSFEHRRKISESNLKTKAPLRKQERSVLRDLRKSFEYNEWRIKVYKRDDYTCQMCGDRGNGLKIDAHHTLSFVDYPEHRFNVDNGITFCKECHGIIASISNSGDIFQPLPQLNI